MVGALHVVAVRVTALPWRSVAMQVWGLGHDTALGLPTVSMRVPALHVEPLKT